MKILASNKLSYDEAYEQFDEFCNIYFPNEDIGGERTKRKSDTCLVRDYMGLDYEIIELLSDGSIEFRQKYDDQGDVRNTFNGDEEAYIQSYSDDKHIKVEIEKKNEDDENSNYNVYVTGHYNSLEDFLISAYDQSSMARYCPDGWKQVFGYDIWESYREK